MKFKSPLISQASGSVGGGTYAHNQGGLYIRNRSIPVNTNTPKQAVVRNAMKTLSAAWSTSLSAAQRAGYNAYAAGITLVNTLGDQFHASGINMYIRNNAPRIQASLALETVAPTATTLPVLTAPVVTATATTGTNVASLSVAFTGSDAWVSNAAGALLVFQSPPQSAGVSYYKGPYEFVGKVTGTGTGVASPATIVGAYAAPAGMRVFIRTRATIAGGGLSSDQLTSFLN